MNASAKEREIARRFDDRAADYARARPSYPAAALDAVFAELAPPATVRVADVGAGTGISSRLLAERGARVAAFEPNAEMRAHALASGVDARDATAEHLPLDDASVDLVTCFQSFHWFATHAALREFARVLAPAGRLALVWNERDDRDAFTRDYGALVDRFAREVARAGFGRDEELVRMTFSSETFGPVRKDTFPNEQRLDRDGLIGRARSTSYVPREAAPYADLVAELAALVARYGDADGCVVLKYRTDVYRTERVA